MSGRLSRIEETEKAVVGLEMVLYLTFSKFRSRMRKRSRFLFSDPKHGKGNSRVFPFDFSLWCYAYDVLFHINVELVQIFEVEMPFSRLFILLVD